jgi:putative transposase
MAKPYSQDLRDRVIEAVERGKLSRRAAARHYEVSESVAIKWLERLERHARESLSDMAAIAPPS